MTHTLFASSHAGVDLLPVERAFHLKSSLCGRVSRPVIHGHALDIIDNAFFGHGFLLLRRARARAFQL